MDENDPAISFAEGVVHGLRLALAAARETRGPLKGQGMPWAHHAEPTALDVTKAIEAILQEKELENEL